MNIFAHVQIYAKDNRTVNMDNVKDALFSLNIAYQLARTDLEIVIQEKDYYKTLSLIESLGYCAY
jgi:hypothetical protein